MVSPPVTMHAGAFTGRDVDDNFARDGGVHARRFRASRLESAGQHQRAETQLTRTPRGGVQRQPIVSHQDIAHAAE